MFYCIDFDTRRVESKSESREPLEQYLEDLSPGIVAIIDSPDELCLEFTLEELTDVYGQLNGNLPRWSSEDEAAEAVWEALQEHESEFPKFTPKLAKKLLQGEKQEKQEKPAPTKPASKPAKNAPKAAKITLDLEAPISIIDGQCKAGSILSTIVKAVEEELCETVGEVMEYITSNHVIPKTGELADEKFAQHNIKYFFKQGKIAIGDNL